MPRGAPTQASSAGTRPPVWLPTGSARYTGLRVEKPLLLIFYHVEKTGGSAVMKWLHKMANNKSVQEPRLTSLFDFTHSTCFLSLYPDLYPAFASAWDDRRCSAPVAPAWQTSAISVEFHAYARRRYWETVVPHLPALRKRYAEAGGRVLTVTLFREPVSHVMSSYRMWPPATKCKKVTPSCPMVGKHAVALPGWLPSAVGLQAGSLTLDSWPHWRQGFHNDKGCTVLPQGRERLASFDVVGVTDCMEHLLTSLCKSFRWPCEADQHRLQSALAFALKFKPHGLTYGSSLYRESQAWGHLDLLNESVRSRVVQAADCDVAIYHDALKRSGLPLPVPPTRQLNRSLCPAATYVGLDGQPLAAG